MKKDDKRQIILLAAAGCFSKYGFEKTTLEDIGKAVGLNKASLYYYYKNKENIYCDVILSEAEVFLQGLQRKVKSAKSNESKIVNYLVERLSFYGNIANIHHLTLDSILKVEPVFNEIYGMVLAKEIDFVRTLLKAGQEQGEFGKFDPSRVAEILMELAVSIRYKAIHSAAARMLDKPDDEKMVEDTRLAAKLILKGLRSAQN